MQIVSIKQAVLINAASRYSRIVLQLVFNGVLARILSPDDYGIVAIVMVFTTLFTTIADMGFGPAIVQKKELSKQEIGDIFTLTIYIGVGLASAFLLVVRFLTFFFQDSVYLELGWILCMSVAFNTWNMIPNAILMRNKKFITIAIRTVVVHVGMSFITIILALKGARYYALVYQSVLTAVGTFLWNYYTARPSIHKKIAKNSIDKVLGFSSYQFAFNLVNYMSRNLDNLLIGKIFGNANLGHYDKAYKLMLYPINNLTGVISPVLHPILSDYQKNTAIIYEKYMKVVKLLATIGCFVSVFCYFSSEEIIYIVYGPKWQIAISCFQALSISLAAQMVTSSAGAVFQSLGNTKLLFYSGAIDFLITICGVTLGILSGSVERVALYISLAYLGHFICSFYLLVTLGFRKSILSFYWDLKGVFLVLGVMILSGIVYPLQMESIFLNFLCKMAYFLIIYTIVLRVTGQYRNIWDFVRKG